jgi:hypothetical protein
LAWEGPRGRDPILLLQVEAAWHKQYFYPEEEVESGAVLGPVRLSWLFTTTLRNSYNDACFTGKDTGA